jgi:hypothetical protein
MRCELQSSSTAQGQVLVYNVLKLLSVFHDLLVFPWVTQQQPQALYTTSRSSGPMISYTIQYCRLYAVSGTQLRQSLHTHL